MRPFHETPSLSLLEISITANQHHANLLEDLAEKTKIIEKLESEIDTLRTELEETRDQLDNAHQSAPPSGKSSKGVSELMKAKEENKELISKNHLLEDQVDDLNNQIKKLKEVSNLRKSHEGF